MSTSTIADMFNVFFPIVFIWSTPLLVKYKICLKGKSPFLGHSLSRYISTPQATGMMAVSMFGVSNIMISRRFLKAFKMDTDKTSPDAYFLTEEDPGYKKTVFILTGYVYEYFFGMFLCFPTIWKPQIHACVVTTFIMSAYIHMVILQTSPLLTNKYIRSLRLLNFIGTTSLISLVTLATLVSFRIRLPPHLFWSFECSGLSSLILFMHFAQLSLPVSSPTLTRSLIPEDGTML